jgi:hypothetical protein
VFKASDVLIESFVERMAADYRTAFISPERGHLEALVTVARMALARMGFTNALYTNMTATLLLTQVSTDVLRGRMIERGDVSSSDWLHFLVSSLCSLIGFVRGSVPGDKGRLLVIDANGMTLDLPRGATDGVLYVHAVERSKLFVRHFFRNHPVIDGERVAGCIEYTRFPALPDRNPETGNWPGLLRGAQTIAVVSDPRFTQRMKYFYLQLREAGLAELLGYQSAADILATFPARFWQMLYPQIGDATNYLKYTGDGLAWLASMNAHMLEEEHRADIRRGPARVADGAARAGAPG